MYSLYKGLQNNTTVLSTPDKHQAFEELEQGVRAALETYSNVHRGTGHYSMISTELFERAREIIIEYLGLKKKAFGCFLHRLWFRNIKATAAIQKLPYGIEPGCRFTFGVESTGNKKKYFT